MKNKFFIFLFTAFILITLSACSMESEPTLYEVNENNFEISDYDFTKYTNVTSSGQISHTYGFSAKVKCSQPLTECTAVLNFYSNEEKLLASKTINKSNPYEANETIDLTATIEKNVYEKAYKIDISVIGKSKDNPQNTNNDSTPITLKYYDVSFFDGEILLKTEKYKSGEFLTEAKAYSPNKFGYVFYGWYTDKQLTRTAAFPVEVSNDVRLYADWLKTEQTITCKDIKIKNWSGYSAQHTYVVTPTGFDYDRLEKIGYNIMRIKVTYDVYYEKDYDILLDIGYAGAPKYSFYFTNSTGFTISKSKLTTQKTKYQAEYETTILISSAKNGTWHLEFSTENVQNIVHVENIKIEYEFVK